MAAPDRPVEDTSRQAWRYRRGLEVDLKWMASPRWSLLLSANLSRNRISEWTQFYDVYAESGAWVGSEPITYRDVPPLLSPELTLNAGVSWSDGDTGVGVSGRHVAASHLDNTGLEGFRTPSFTVLDLRASAGLGRWLPGRPKVTLFVNNVLDELEQYASGYSYQFLNRDGSGRDALDGIPFYYPLAGRNIVVSLHLDL